MTGKEKLQAVIDAIETEYKGLIQGNVVQISSDELESIGLRLEELLPTNTTNM